MDSIRVGDFELFPSERVLSSEGRPVELGARAFDMLLVLVESPGRLVTKATLLDRVWPKVIVDENNLPAQIASLRRVLGAEAIRTVPGFGYRLELQVSRAAATGTGAAASSACATPALGVTPTSAPVPEDVSVSTAPFVAADDPRERGPRLSVPRRTWPNRLGPLVGRDDEIRDLQAALYRSCLLTLVGVAGVGKTRLAQEILARAAEKPDAAVAWISLGPIREPEHIPSAIAIGLGLSLPDGVDGFTALSQALEHVPVLLILDCAEHLVDALATPLADLIAQTQSVRALVTSQVPLGIAGEIVYRLAVLPVPDRGAPQEEAARYAAVELFAQRAGAADRKFELCATNTPLVAEICRRLDGIPLALELAAARVPALGLAALLERLDDRFRLLKLSGRAAEPRHNTLHAAFDWSYSLLPAAEQRIFNLLGTFTGSFSLKAAVTCVVDEATDASEAVDLISRLVDRSLVTVLAADPPRYTLLETARHYALGRLTADGELQAARARMAAAVLELIDLAYEEYWSLDEAIWLHRYEPDLDNVRTAIDWALVHDSALGVALFGSAWPLFVETDLYGEGRTRYSQVLALLSDSLPRIRVGRFWEAIAAYDSTRQCDRARYAADLAAAKYSETSHIRSHYYALMQIAFSWRVDTAAARAAFDAARVLEDPAWPARVLTHGAMTEGALLMSAGKLVEARAAYERAVRLALVTSERQAFAASVSMVELDIACGNTADALTLGRPLALSLRHLGRRETRFELLVLIFSAMLINGEIAEARSTGAELFSLALRIDTSRLYTALDAMALLACEEGRYDAAARIAIYADVTHEIHGLVRRRPAEERMQTAVVTALNKNLGSQWRTTFDDSQALVDEEAACSLALGFSA
ncbi:MAG TPA: winged helix-turn-helix domain-containing protein [Steroidobacteraceae bacterium]|nr:winged helix-turn-helix domain-containing protein [Steroidobacteraceae bacterium]